MNGDPPSFDLAGFQAQLNEAHAALRDFAQREAPRAADDIGEAFERAGVRIARALGRAGAAGEVSFRRMAKIILEELAKLALDRIFNSGGAASFMGARAAGGAVTPGGAYLVGERGPEMFVPRHAGAIAPMAAAVNVHFHLGAGADAASIQRHQGQIAAHIARAVAYGSRNL